MKRFRLLPFTFCLLLAPAALAGTSMFATPPTTATRNNITGMFGATFKLTAPQTLTKIGRLYVSGNTHDHVARIWNSGGTLLAKATITAASSSDAAGFKWVAITPLALAASTQYVMTCEETNAQDTWKDQWTANTSMQASLFTSFFGTAWGTNQTDSLPANISNGIGDAGTNNMFGTVAFWYGSNGGAVLAGFCLDAGPAIFRRRGALRV